MLPAHASSVTRYRQPAVFPPYCLVLLGVACAAGGRAGVAVLIALVGLTLLPKRRGDTGAALLGAAAALHPGAALLLPLLPALVLAGRLRFVTLVLAAAAFAVSFSLLPGSNAAAMGWRASGEFWALLITAGVGGAAAWIAWAGSEVRGDVGWMRATLLLLLGGALLMPNLVTAGIAAAVAGGLALSGAPLLRSAANDNGSAAPPRGRLALS